MDKQSVAEWLGRYVEAWKTYERAAIEDLFSEDVSYRYHPYDEPVVGRGALVDSWLEDRDEAGTYEGTYEPVAVDGETAVAVGHSTYNRDGGTVVYDNCFVMRFDEDGRCRTFTEWFVKRP